MWETAKMLLIVCPVVFLASIIDSVAGGGGLLTLPVYMAVGLPLHQATATNKCSSTLGVTFSAIRFFREKKMHMKSACISAVFAFCASIFGAWLNMHVDEKYIRYLLLIILPVIAGIIFFKKDFGAGNRIAEMKESRIVLVSILLGLVIGVYDGFFGPGAGTFLILGYTALAGFDLITASGNAKAVNMASNIAAFTTFALGGKIVWQLGIPAAFFGIAGNWVGAGLAVKKGNKVIRPMVFVALTLLLAKIIYDFVM